MNNQIEQPEITAHIHQLEKRIKLLENRLKAETETNKDLVDLCEVLRNEINSLRPKPTAKTIDNQTKLF